MRASVQSFIIFTSILSAEPTASLVIPKPEAWTGQRIPVFVELRAEGTFSGATSFDIPEIPQAIIVKIGTPVISSETNDDTEYFVQRHEFAIFSQSSGAISLPPITARFSHKKGYTGPTFDASVSTEASTLILKRPPNSESLGFLVTTTSLSIEEKWDPAPGPVETGTVFKRTIVQRATQLTGIALKPAPNPEIDGVRTYPASPEVIDNTERGQFLGERREILSYLVQQPGLHTLPEIRYNWWNPASETLESLILPSVTFSATSPPPPPAKPSPLVYLWSLLPLGLLAIGTFCRKRLSTSFHKIHNWVDPPMRRAARAFLKACESDNPQRAAETWVKLQCHHPDFVPSEDLIVEIKALYETLYGTRIVPKGWSGKGLASAYRNSENISELTPRQTHLPELNP